MLRLKKAVTAMVLTLGFCGILEQSLRADTSRLTKPACDSAAAPNGTLEKSKNGPNYTVKGVDPAAPSADGPAVAFIKKEMLIIDNAIVRTTVALKAKPESVEELTRLLDLQKERRNLMHELAALYWNRQGTLGNRKGNPNSAMKSAVSPNADGAAAVSLKRKMLNIDYEIVEIMRELKSKPRISVEVLTLRGRLMDLQKERRKLDREIGEINGNN